MMSDIKKSFCQVLQPVVMAFNRVDSRLLIFLILCLNLLSFVPSGNEETYFALAKQYADPDWIPGSFTFTEWVGNRFVFQWIAGPALRFLSFEQLAFWGRMFTFFCYCFPLALIFKELNVKNLGILLVLQLYILKANTQHFFGMEWIFGDFESKTLAYIFVFYGVYFLLRARYQQAALFAALASYLHILVGGWFFVLVFLYACIQDFSFRQAFRIGFIYVIAVLPFVIYLAAYLTESGSIIQGVDIDWVYAFFRNTHHTAPMHTAEAMQKVLPRVVVSFILLLLSVFYFRKSPQANIRKLNTMALIALGIIFVGLGISYVDVHGRLLKYYLFRIAAIGTFSYYLLILLYLREVFDRKFDPVCLRSLGLLCIGTFFLIKAGKNVSRLLQPEVNPELAELSAYVSENTRPEDVFLFREQDELSFPRRARREALVIFKFDPGGGEKIYEWYRREKMRRQLQTDITYLDTITRQYRLDYLITSLPVEYPELKEVFQNKKYYLYEIVKGE